MGRDKWYCSYKSAKVAGCNILASVTFDERQSNVPNPMQLATPCHGTKLLLQPLLRMFENWRHEHLVEVSKKDKLNHINPSGNPSQIQSQTNACVLSVDSIL